MTGRLISYSDMLSRVETRKVGEQPGKLSAFQIYLRLPRMGYDPIELRRAAQYVTIVDKQKKEFVNTRSES